ncbi:MAG: hypothetical protein Q8R28_10660 [Dehalococcoidia bacterium]|nr:hypothetical protein [Dehalococcoidia bacterium]
MTTQLWEPKVGEWVRIVRRNAELTGHEQCKEALKARYGDIYTGIIGGTYRVVGPKQRSFCAVCDEPFPGEVYALEVGLPRYISVYTHQLSPLDWVPPQLGRLP